MQARDFTATKMQAMQFSEEGSPLEMVERPVPVAKGKDILIEVTACGVCRTDLHIIDGEIRSNSPIVPGHEVVGQVAGKGELVTRFELGDRVGVSWLGGTCGQCLYCVKRQENLCDNPVFTGFSVHGGYASHTLANADFCFAIPDNIDDAQAAPLLCAGLIGFRALSMCGDALRIGFYGFGASAHIIAQIATKLGCKIAAFTRPRDQESQKFARQMGCVWAGGSDMLSPFKLDAAIIFAPVGELVPQALAATRKGGVVVCAGIHMSDIPAFPYELLGGERQVRSVANLTRSDGECLFTAIAAYPIQTQIEKFALRDANKALKRLREGSIIGAAVLIP